MKTLLVAFLLVCSIHVVAQQTKAKNEIVIMMDGYRWNEVFNGADSSLLFNKKYTSQDSGRLMEKYWAKDADIRRKKLMPFVWNVIAKQGQVYGNRNLGNNVNVKNPYWFSYPGAAKPIPGLWIRLLTQMSTVMIQMKMFLNISISKKGIMVRW